VTYEEMNGRANQVGEYLRRRGVREEEMVGVLMERGVEMVIGLIGILKAGAAYVPLDPAYPQDRLAFMCQDAAVKVILTQSRLLELLPQNDLPVLCLDTDWGTLAALPSNNLPRLNLPAQVAYVIYTSGSTGQPKGVANTQDGILNRLLWMQDAYGLTAADRVLQKTPFSFDVSVWEFFWPLMNGARLVMARPGGHRNSQYLVDLIEEQGITTLHFVPSMLEVFIEEPGLEERCASVRQVMCSGEALSVELQRRFYARMKKALLHNLYGPTEAAVDVTSWACERDSQRQSVPIGRPIANTQLYILDQYLQVAPVGVAGELHIGGINLSRGYLNRPELTAEKFIPNPFGERAGERIYKTGDLARYQPGGEIEYLGRLDYQVKLRGHRIELGEIEAVLREHQEVREAVALVREESATDKRLVAYLIATQEGAAPGQRELREYLKERLPDYMIPSAFVLLSQWPLTPSGKIDRRALPPPDAKLEKSFVGPRDELEQELTQIWEEVLQVQPIGVTDDFFEIGGHSMLAVRLMSRIKERTGKSLPLAVMFPRATIEHLAELLRQDAAIKLWSPLVALQPQGHKRPFFCVHAVGGNALSYIPLVKYLDQDRPFYALQAQGLEEGQVPLARIEEMASSYVDAVRAVQPQGPYLLGGWSLGGMVAFEMAQQLQAQKQEVSLLALIDSSISRGDQPVVEDTAKLLTSFALDLGVTLDSFNISWDVFSHLASVEQLTYAFAQAKASHILPAEMDFAQFQRLFNVFKTNSRALGWYEPHAFPGQVTLLKASEPVPTPRQGRLDALRRRWPFRKDKAGEAQAIEGPFLGWDKWTTGGVELHLIPGNHYTMVSDPHVEHLSRQLQACINKADKD
jgi:amino acid adenylation domain-containing protein